MTETRLTGQARISAYHAQTQRTGPSRAWLERITAGFRVNPQYEQILKLSPEKREALLSRSPTLRIGVGRYEQTKAAKEELEAMTS